MNAMQCVQDPCLIHIGEITRAKVASRPHLQTLFKVKSTHDLVFLFLIDIIFIGKNEVRPINTCNTNTKQLNR